MDADLKNSNTGLPGGPRPPSTAAVTIARPRIPTPVGATTDRPPHPGLAPMVGITIARGRVNRLPVHSARGTIADPRSRAIVSATGTQAFGVAGGQERAYKSGGVACGGGCQRSGSQSRRTSGAGCGSWARRWTNLESVSPITVLAFRPRRSEAFSISASVSVAGKPMSRPPVVHKGMP
jgi:hypothetical protein